jgi:hypothetical protein
MAKLTERLTYPNLKLQSRNQNIAHLKRPLILSEEDFLFVNVTWRKIAPHFKAHIKGFRVLILILCLLHLEG